MNQKIHALLCTMLVSSLSYALQQQKVMMQHPEHNSEDAGTVAYNQIYKKMIEEVAIAASGNFEDAVQFLSNANMHDEVPQAQSHARNSRFTFDLETNASEQEKKFHDDVITAYQLQQGKVTANNPINSLTHYHVREILPSGKVITKKYKNLSHGKDRAELDKRLEMAKLLLNSRLKRIIPCIILLVAMYQSKGLLDLVGRTLVNMEYRMLNGVAICCGNQAAEILFFVFTLAKQLLPYYVMSVLPNYLGNTFGAWRDTKNLPKEIETFEKEKGTWEFVSSHNEHAPVVDEKDMREYADKITAGLQKQLQDAHEVVVDINNLNILQQALQPSVNN